MDLLEVTDRQDDVQFLIFAKPLYAPETVIYLTYERLTLRTKYGNYYRTTRWWAKRSPKSDDYILSALSREGILRKALSRARRYETAYSVDRRVLTTERR